MPPGLIDQEHRMGSWSDHLGDFRKMQVHCFGVAGRQDQGRAFALFGANGTEDVGRSGALIAGCARTGATLGPSARDLVLLADTRLVLEPNLYGLDIDRFFTRNFIQARWEVFLKSSTAPAAWA